jgi:hypothetical protein
MLVEDCSTRAYPLFSTEGKSGQALFGHPYPGVLRRSRAPLELREAPRLRRISIADDTWGQEVEGYPSAPSSAHGFVGPGLLSSPGGRY